MHARSIIEMKMLYAFLRLYHWYDNKKTNNESYENVRVCLAIKVWKPSWVLLHSALVDNPNPQIRWQVRDRLFRTATETAGLCIYKVIFNNVLTNECTSQYLQEETSARVIPL